MITLADIANLKPHVTDMRDQALATVITALHGIPRGPEIAADYLAALRELDVLNKLELELITHGKPGLTEASHN
jgi:hypothetical protein